jgi:hypothetical protein
LLDSDGDRFKSLDSSQQLRDARTQVRHNGALRPLD